ncbi:MAG: flagellar M-ring protein FliF, partial [Acidobacteria bacterium]
LEPAVGQGKIRPQVSIVMNFEQVEETVEQYDPQHSVVRSEQKQEERQPKAERFGGIPGPRSTPTNNPAGAPAAQADQSAGRTHSDFVKQNETVNYEVSKAVRHVVNPVGKIERVSVAVVIDNHTKVTTGSDGKEQTSQEPRTPEEMKKYRDLVSAAIGFNPDRG